jgi:predicted nucleotidyltransferase
MLCMRRYGSELIMHAVVSSRLDALAEICRRFHVRRLDVFGSVARGEDFDPARSDADFLVEFQPGTKPNITALLDMEEALHQVIGRPVDLVERQAVEESRNYLRRRRILREAQPVYVEG